MVWCWCCYVQLIYKLFILIQSLFVTHVSYSQFHHNHYIFKPLTIIMDSDEGLTYEKGTDKRKKPETE